MASAAHPILDGLEQGLEKIYRDLSAAEYGDTYAANPKELQERIAALSAAPTYEGIFQRYTCRYTQRRV